MAKKNGGNKKNKASRKNNAKKTTPPVSSHPSSEQLALDNASITTSVPEATESGDVRKECKTEDVFDKVNKEEETETPREEIKITKETVEEESKGPSMEKTEKVEHLETVATEKREESKSEKPAEKDERSNPEAVEPQNTKQTDPVESEKFKAEEIKQQSSKEIEKAKSVEPEGCKELEPLELTDPNMEEEKPELIEAPNQTAEHDQEETREPKVTQAEKMEGQDEAQGVAHSPKTKDNHPVGYEEAKTEDEQPEAVEQEAKFEAVQVKTTEIKETKAEDKVEETKVKEIPAEETQSESDVFETLEEEIKPKQAEISDIKAGSVQIEQPKSADEKIKTEQVVAEDVESVQAKESNLADNVPLIEASTEKKEEETLPEKESNKEKKILKEEGKNAIEPSASQLVERKSSIKGSNSVLTASSTVMSSTASEGSKSLVKRSKSIMSQKNLTRRKSQIVSLFKRGSGEKVNTVTPPPVPSLEEKKPEKKLKSRKSWMFWKSSTTK